MDPGYFRGRGGYADSDQSSSVMGAPYNRYGGVGGPGGGRSNSAGFNSARLVQKSVNNHGEGVGSNRRHSAAPTIDRGPASGYQGHHGSSRELDREGRMIRSRTHSEGMGMNSDRHSVASSSLAPSAIVDRHRSRNYSGGGGGGPGYSDTSPDRETSPDGRYARPSASGRTQNGIRSYSSGSHQV